MSQQVQGGYEVAPLDKLTQRAPAEGIFCYFEARLLSQQTQVYQDLMEIKGTEISCVSLQVGDCAEDTNMEKQSTVQILKDYCVTYSIM